MYNYNFDPFVIYMLHWNSIEINMSNPFLGGKFMQAMMCTVMSRFDRLTLTTYILGITLGTFRVL